MLEDKLKACVITIARPSVEAGGDNALKPHTCQDDTWEGDLVRILGLVECLVIPCTTNLNKLDQPRGSPGKFSELVSDDMAVDEASL